MQDDFGKNEKVYEQIINFAQIYSYFSSEFGLISEGVFTASLNLEK